MEDSFTKRAVRQWNRLPRKVVGSPFQEVFKRQVDSEFGEMV